MICQNCEYTDGNVYTSFPPQLRCTITNDYYEYSHVCEMEWKPEIKGEWIKLQPDNWLDGEYQCPNCKWVVDIATGEDTPLDREFYHCPYCGAKLGDNNES